MTPEQITEIKNRNLDSLSGNAPYNPDVWDLVADRDALLAEVERHAAIRNAGDKARILAGIRGDLLHETRQKLDAAQRAGRELQDQAARMAEENTRLVAEVERLTAALTAAGIVERVGGLIDQWLDGEISPQDALNGIHEQVGDR